MGRSRQRMGDQEVRVRGYGIAGLGLSGGKRPFFKKVLGQYSWGSGRVLGGFGSHKVGLYTSKATISVIFFHFSHNHEGNLSEFR